MYTKNNRTLSLEDAQANASAVGMELNDWASTFGWSSEGKQNDLTETDPPANQNTETSVGESNSGDISLGSPNPAPVDKALKALADIDISEDFKQLEENIDVVKRTPIMTETARGTMTATGGFYETRAYDDYMDSAKVKLGEGAGLIDIEEKAKALYLNAQKKALVDRKAEEILEEFDNEIYTPLGRLRKYSSQVFSGADFSEGGKKRKELADKVEQSKNTAYARIDELSQNRAAQETYLINAGNKLNVLQDKYENNPDSITPEDVVDYNSMSTSFNNVLNTYKETEAEMADAVAEGESIEQLVDLTKRSYDNLDIAGGRIASSVLNIASGLTQVADEVVRLGNPIYTPVYASISNVDLNTPLQKGALVLKAEAD
jgi:hypothetical protein